MTVTEMSERLPKHLWIYCLGIIAALCTVFALNGNIRGALMPHVSVMKWLYGFEFIFVPGVGYQQVNGFFTISQSCLGSRLFFSLYLIMIIGFLGRFTNIREKVKMSFVYYSVSFAAAFLFTMLRISISLPFCTSESFKLIHNILSLAIYFGAGILLYSVTDKLLKRKCNA